MRWNHSVGRAAQFAAERAHLDLRAMGSTVFIVAETSNSIYRRRQYAMKGFAHLRKVLSETGMI
jgi:hypothetical protein